MIEFVLRGLSAGDSTATIAAALTELVLKDWLGQKPSRASAGLVDAVSQDALSFVDAVAGAV